MSEQLKEPKSLPPIRNAMTPEKSIEILQEWLSSSYHKFDPDHIDAVQLAIKALRDSITANIKRGLR